jgi:hypothetical protein
MSKIVASHSLISALLLSLLLAACVNNDSKPATEAAPAATAVKAAEPAPPLAVATEVKPVCKDAPAPKSKAKKAAKGKASTDCVAAAPTTAPTVAPVAPVDVGAYDLAKNKPVTDSSKVESGQGTQVKGINDWQGEISGVPVAGSKFTKLKIGMAQKQVTDLIGEPTDQGVYVTGKAFIPFYFGSDKSRWEMVYKGQGRLIFANQAGFGSGYYLTWVIHNASEGGYR